MERLTINQIKTILLLVFIVVSQLSTIVIATPENANSANDLGTTTINSPLPKNFIDHNSAVATGEDTHQTHVPVHKDKVFGVLIGNLKGAAAADDRLEEECNHGEAIQGLKAAATDRLKSPLKAERFVRAIAEKLNASCDEVNQIKSSLSHSPEHAEKVRRAVEDAAVLQDHAATAAQQQQNNNKQQGLPPTVASLLPPSGQINPPFFGGGGPGLHAPPAGGLFQGGHHSPPPFPFRFGGAGQSPFFSVPMTSPALEIDLDRLMFLATPKLGINKAFELTKILHTLHSPRQEVFELQEKFQSSNMTQPEAEQVLKEYQDKLVASNDNNKLNQSTTTTTPPTAILHNTAQLSGLNDTEAHRFTRALEHAVGPLNSTQALQIHRAISGSGLNKSELIGVTEEIEKLRVGTTTPEGATGHDWIFSSSSEDKNKGNKRSAIGGGGDGGVAARLFSSSKACGFAINTKFGVVYPWMATISCKNMLCSGTLVSTTSVLTAADCVLACGNEPVKVLLGDVSIAPPLEIYAKSAVVNPRNSQDDPSFNMALVELSTPVDLNENPFINPICLLYTETDDPDIQCEVVMCHGSHDNVHDHSLIPVTKSLVQCYQPTNQICPQSGLLKSKACVSLHNCIPIQTQKSAPIMCHRKSKPNRYYLWAVTIPEHSPTKCFNGVARVSDNALFLQGKVFGGSGSIGIDANMNNV